MMPEKFNHTIYIQDRFRQTVGNTSAHYDDEHYMDVEKGSSTYNFRISKRTQESTLLQPGYKIIFKDKKGQAWEFTIMTIEQTRNEMIVSCENVGMELINKTVNKWELFPEAHPFEYYFNLCVGNSGWVININEISNMSRKVEFDGRHTALQRILYLLNAFDNAEIDFQVELSNARVVRKFVNIYRKRGTDRSNVQVVYGNEVNDIVKTEDLSDLATSLAGVGSAIEGTNDNVYFRDIVYDDGDFYTELGSAYVKSRRANNIYNLQTTREFLEDFYEYDTSNQQDLFNRTLTQLKKRCEPLVNYEVDLIKIDETLELGDYITIIDHDYFYNNSPLYLKARLLTQTISYKDPSKNKAVFGNYILLFSNIDDRLRELASQIDSLSRVPTKVYNPWTAFADDEQGTNFSLTWSGQAYSATVYRLNQPIPSQDVNDYIGYFVRIQGNDGAPGQPGEDGVTRYTWFAYADDPQGNGISLNPLGKTYAGIGYNKLTNAPTLNPIDYDNWYFMGDRQMFDDLSNEINNFVVPVVSELPPPDPVKENQQWWQVDSSNKVIGYFIYKNGAWEPLPIDQAVLNIIELNAVTINTSNFVGGTISGAEFINTFDYLNNAQLRIVGTTKIKGGIEMQWILDGTDQNGVFSINPDGIYSISYLDAEKTNVAWSWSIDSGGVRFASGSQAQGNLVSASYGNTGITMSDYTKTYGNVNLTYSDLISLPAQPIPAGNFYANYVPYATSGVNQPKFSRQGRLIQLTGAVRPTTTIPSATDTVPMFVLPVGVRPANTVNLIAQGSGMDRFMLVVQTDGIVGWQRYGTTTSNNVPVNAFLNISCVYTTND